MHEAPARIHVSVIEQPGDWPLPAPRDAVVDLFGLLGDVDVNGRGGIDRVESGKRLAQAFGRHGAQRMRREAEPGALRIAQWLEAFEESQHRVGRADESPLTFTRCGAAEAAGLVQHGQQSQADAGALRSTHKGQRERGVVGIRTAIGVVVHIVKLADRRVAGLDHFDVEAERDGFHLRRVEPQRETVHQGAPAPEAVLLSIDALAAEFSEAGDGTLKGMRVKIGHARDERAFGDGGVSRGSRIGFDFGQSAFVVP